MKNMTHDDFESLLGAYALDAVDADEAEAVELHLRDCPRCRSEVQEHREAASYLAHTGQPAPEGGWHRLAESLDEEPPRLDMARITAAGRQPSSLPLRWRRLAVMTTAAAAVIALLAGATVVRMNSRIDDLNAEVASASSIRDEALRAAGDPARREVRLASNQGTQAAEAVLLPDGRLYMLHSTLAPLPADRTYQLWGVFPEGRVVSLGLLGNDPEVAMFRADPGVTALAITAERAGGVVTSVNAPTVAGTVPL